MLGVCVVVLAMLGTVLSGFVMGIDASTREVTSYDYVTDVTGLFDISDAPEYVEYNPSSNLVGYTPNTVNYVPSSTVNSYRYIAQEGAVSSSTYTITNSSTDLPLITDRFRQSEVGGQAYINWTGAINFGSTVQSHGITYNASVPSAQYDDPSTDVVDVIPRMTSLGSVLTDMGLGAYRTASIDITYGEFPVMFYYGGWTFTDVPRGDGATQYVYSATLNESLTMPTHFDVNVTTNSVTAYRGNTLMWNVNADQVDVIYIYSTRASGSFSPASTSAVFTVTSVGYPTYGYMDPTKGVSMDISDYAVDYSLPSDIPDISLVSGYDMYDILPKLPDTMNVFAYLSNFGGWDGNWTGSMTMNDYTFQGIIATENLDPSIPTLFNKIISFKKCIVENFGLGAYPEYKVYFDNGDFPIYMGKLGLNGLPQNFTRIGTYADASANQLQTIYYLETAYCPIITYATYDTATDMVYAYTGTEGSYNLEWSADANEVWMITQYYLMNSSNTGTSPTTDGYYGHVAPVDTAVHITAERQATSTWANGYSNDEITISVQRYNMLGNDLTIRAGTSYVTIYTNNSGYMTADINGEIRNIGMWRNAQINISAVNGTLSITPLSSISFTKPSNTNNSTIVIDDWYSGDAIEQLVFSTDSQSLRWQVTQTTVFLDTYNAVMYDPSISINDYFPDIDEWRLNFFSFAIYGDSMTINDVYFTVNRANATVSFNIDDKTYTHTLQNIYVTNQEVDGADHILLSFGNSKDVYDLGETVSETISFTGLWYFTTGLYKAVTVLENYYDWSLDGLWHLTSEQTIVIYLGLLALGMLVMKGLFHVNVKSMDGVIVIFAGLIGLMVVI